ncbi:MAG: amidohydrolase [Bacteroidales bacterium]|nr:amidohydrolase [Bacteroidales bacterium]
MKTLLKQIKTLATATYPETVEFRRHLHQYPELSFHEKETSAFVAKQLNAWGIPHQQNVSGYGVVGLIEGRNAPAGCVGLRADMDALPITERSDKSYRSCNPGVMHACGHDAHTAILLSTAHILQQLRHEFEGTVKLIFQPAEEKLPGGAIGMINAGILQHPTVDAIVGLHVLPSMAAGSLGFRSGAFMASSDEITICITGKGGHAAMPHLSNDTILAAGHVIVALQQLVSRMNSPLIPSVLSFGNITTEGAHNILPSEVVISGTFRTFDENWRLQAHEKIKNIAIHTAAASGTTAEVTIGHGYPVVRNDNTLTRLAMDISTEMIGKQNVQEIEARMTAEDFGWYGQHVPACFFRLGTAGIAPETASGLHSPTFDIDENSLLTGVTAMSSIAVHILNSINLGKNEG